MNSKKKLFLIIGIAVAVLGLLALGLFGFWLPYAKAVSQFPQGRMVTLSQQENGRIRIQWPESENADRYCLEVLVPEAEKAAEDWTVEFAAHVTGKPEHMLMPLAKGERAIRIRTEKAYRFLFDGEDRFRLSEDVILLQDDFTAPAAPVPTWTFDPDGDTLTVKLEMEAGCSARAFWEAEEPIAQIPGNETVLSFGEGKQLPMPGFHDTYEITFEASRQTDDYVFYGARSKAVPVTREDLLGQHIEITMTEEPGNAFVLKWNEAKGDYYLLQERTNENGKWEDVKRYAVDGDLTYTTENLSAYSYREYRVVTYRHGDASGAEPMSKSPVTPLQTKSSLVFSTIWPIKDLPVYADTSKATELGTAGKGKAFCVLALEEGLFKIRTKDGYGYIDSNYCMINLPDFLGELLRYNITNSYESMYIFHDVKIPDVTGEVVTGYERVKLGSNKYLVPYIYPAALKLEKAGLAAREEGYYLKIYDSYRPQAATIELYGLMEDMCKDPVLQPPVENADGSLTYPKDEQGNPLYILKEDGTPLTLQEYITDKGRYKLNYFLAKGTSRHNRGAALDLTLEKNGKDVKMQTAIHDLTYHSETAKNNGYASKLAKIMKGAGFTGLVSEWWHFQDNESMNALELPALYKGVTPEGWVADAKGWRYRRANGSFYENCTKTIDGVDYTFNTEGYAPAPDFEK